MFELDTYLAEHSSVSGWFMVKHNVRLLRCLNEFHLSSGVKGNLGEIGLYQGKSFIPLVLISSDGEKVLGIDTFHKCGVKEALHSNCKKFCGKKVDRIVIRTGSSLSFSHEDYIRLSSGKFRAWSIDGCHELRVAIGDIRKATLSLVDRGFIFIDDFMSIEHIEVNEAVTTLCNNGEIHPFAIAGHRIYVAKCEESADEMFNYVICKCEYTDFKKWNGHSIAVI